MKLKIISKLFILLFVLSCGYQPLYSNKNQNDLKIKEIELLGDNTINRKIISFLKITENSPGNGAFKILIDSKKNNEVSSRDNLGNPSTYRMKINTSLTMIKNDKIIEKNTFSSSFTYSNIDNKFELNQYEKGIEENLTKSISEKILIFLNLKK